MPRMALVTVRIPRRGPAAPAMRVPPCRASDTPRPAMAAARPGQLPSLLLCGLSKESRPAAALGRIDDSSFPGHPRPSLACRPSRFWASTRPWKLLCHSLPCCWAHWPVSSTCALAIAVPSCPISPLPHKLPAGHLIPSAVFAPKALCGRPLWAPAAGRPHNASTGLDRQNSIGLAMLAQM